jgi:hypothetical protein
MVVIILFAVIEALPFLSLWSRPTMAVPSTSTSSAAASVTPLTALSTV